MKRLIVSLAALVLAGCNAGKVEVQRLAPGEECPEGGVKLFVAGQEPQLFCNGATGARGPAGEPGIPGVSGVDGGSGAVTLVAQTPIPDGDARCPRGGTEVSSGLDSGGDGGVPGDGVLQDAEVTARSIICHGDDNARVGSLVPPAGAAGTDTIKVNGGEGRSMFGGAGGTVELRFASGTNGGHLKAWKTGRASATATVPTPPAANLGAVPLAITADTVITLAPEPSMLAVGTPYASLGGLFLAQGPTAPPKQVTGLSVAAGVTLTLPRTPFLAFRLPGSCRVDGTLKGDDAQGALQLECGDLVLSSASQVVATGTATRPAYDVSLSASYGSLLALGTIDTSGFSGTAPTSGGQISLSAAARVFVRGALRANGGAGAASSPTQGGAVTVTAFDGLSNEATIEARGGAVTAPGEPFAAGRGGQVSLRVVNAAGELRNRGAIDVSGGSVTGCTGCAGGQGGSVQLLSGHASLINDAALTARGGTADLSGGFGGNIELQVAGVSGEVGVPGSLLVSGSIDASGGTGGIGGRGGTVRMTIGERAANGSELVLLGYAAIEANGAVGGARGGNGGVVTFFQAPQGSEAGSIAAGGAVVNAVDVSAKGGEGDTSVSTQANGGFGGRIDFETQYDLEPPSAWWEVVRNTGALNVNGGLGASGGAAGQVILFGRVGVTSSGRLDARGGAAATGGGGQGGSVSLRSASGPVSSSSEVDVSAGVAGGGPSFTPGAGGNVVFEGAPVSNAGTLLAKGGAADLMTGLGGRGGLVVLSSIAAGPTRNTVAAPAGIVVSGGAGQTPGEKGGVVIDGFIVTDQWTH